MEVPLIDDDPKFDPARMKAERVFKQKEEGAQAMAAYQAEGDAVRAKTARLRALRLAQEATDVKEDKPAAPKRQPRTTLSKTGKRLGRPPTKKAIKAEEMAALTIDRLAGSSLPAEERATRKRRLLKGPKEFRDIRGDLPKRQQTPKKR
jgi:hypothetical protein